MHAVSPFVELCREPLFIYSMRFDVPWNDFLWKYLGNVEHARGTGLEIITVLLCPYIGKSDTYRRVYTEISHMN